MHAGLKKWAASGKLLGEDQSPERRSLQWKKLTRRTEYTIERSLYLAFELSKAKWKLGFSTGLGQNPRRRTVDAGDLLALRQEIEAAKRRFGLAADAPVRTCYEAGRDGFWLHRYLQEQKVKNLVVDSSSIEVDRRAKRAKTDRIDVEKLLNMLIRYHSGEERVWRVVYVPSVEAEDMRHLHRQLLTLKVDRTRYICRIKGLLATQGVNVPIHVDFLDTLAAARMWDGAALPSGLCARVEREYASLRYVEQQIKELEAEREELIETSKHPSIEKVRQLMRQPRSHRAKRRLAVCHGVLWLAQVSQST